jgi:SET domain
MVYHMPIQHPLMGQPSPSSLERDDDDYDVDVEVDEPSRSSSSPSSRSRRRSSFLRLASMLMTTTMQTIPTTTVMVAVAASSTMASQQDDQQQQHQLQHRYPSTVALSNKRRRQHRPLRPQYRPCSIDDDNDDCDDIHWALHPEETEEEVDEPENDDNLDETFSLSSSCGLWMGPSSIKSIENHGFGMGIFAGRAIKAGTPIESTFYGGGGSSFSSTSASDQEEIYNTTTTAAVAAAAAAVDTGGFGEIILPFYGSDTMYDEHPPVREYVLDEDILPEVAVEFPDVMTAMFIPGIASLAPCTSDNFNLKLASRYHEDYNYNNYDEKSDYDDFHDFDDDDVNAFEDVMMRSNSYSDDGGVHRSTHAQAGAFSYRHNLNYVAVRDIAPGEELTVECNESNFDGSSHAHSLHEFDERSVCLDENIRVDRASDKTDAKGLGVFAKRNSAEGSVLISSPLVPVMRRDMELESRRKDMTDRQLALNYAYGHPDSDLLLLPYGPMVNYINHNHREPNAVIRWHVGPDTDTETATALPPLDRRQEYHHPDLMTLSAEEVSKIHGNGLMMDIVALRDIEDGEEIFLDYGRSWQEAWNKHQSAFERHEPTVEEVWYVSAENFSQELGDSIWMTPLEQSLMPYPSNVETYCYYEQHDDDYRIGSRELLPNLQPHRLSWYDHDDHPCFRPCEIEERYEDEDGELSYTIHLSAADNHRVMFYCSIETDYSVTDVPHDDIRLLDVPYTTDLLRKQSFRHEIGVPDGFFPKAWMRRRIRSRARASTQTNVEGEKFKRR